MTGSWFRSKRFRVEGAPSSLFAVLSPVKRVEEGLSPVKCLEEGLSPVRSRAEEGLSRGTADEQRSLSSSGERRENAWERLQKSEERHIDIERQEGKPYSSSVSSAYSSARNRQAFLDFTFNCFQKQ